MKQKARSMPIDKKQRTALDSGDLYAGIEHDPRHQDGILVYIGGRHYETSAQIHLTKTEAVALRNWLNRRFPRPRRHR